MSSASKPFFVDILLFTVFEHFSLFYLYRLPDEAHPNVKVFISQCGLQSIEESVSRGVPILGIPFIADQEMNIKRLAELEVALGVNFVTVTKQELVDAVKEIVHNPKYKQNMDNLRKLWIDQPMTSMERAIWWIEYVIRHKVATE